MARHSVTGDQYVSIDRKMSEIKDQLNQLEDSSLNPQLVLLALQNIIDSAFEAIGPSALVERSMPLWRKIDDNTIEVNLDAPLTRPPPEDRLMWTAFEQTGWVQVRRHDGGLFVDGHQVAQFPLGQLDKQRIVDKHTNLESPEYPYPGHLTHMRDYRELPIHPNLTDALLENLHLFPESWKMYDKDGKVRYIFIWEGQMPGLEGGMHLTYLCLVGRWWRRFTGLVVRDYR